MQKGSSNIVVILIILLLAVFAIFYFYLSKKDITDTLVNQDTKNSISNAEPEEKYFSTIDIEYLRNMEIDSDAPVIEEELPDGSNYKRYIASYDSEGNTIYGLLTVPNTEAPEGGFPAIVFNHGYIPPQQYRTTEKYVAYVDSLARNGFVVFKIDMRGNGDSEGRATGSYFSSGYTIDAISALKSLQKLDYVNADRIGMWGHSMSGNLVLRAMLVEDEIKAGVIWAGAVYSYEDFAEYRLNDSSYVRRDNDPHYDSRDLESALTKEISKLRENPEDIDFDNDFWSSISLTKNIKYLDSPIQLNHATNDSVVNVGYSRDLAEVLEENNKEYRIYEYDGGGHNIESPYFEQAMQSTVEFFKDNLTN